MYMSLICGKKNGSFHGDMTSYDVNMYQPWNSGIFAISTKAVGFRVVSGEVLH